MSLKSCLALEKKLKSLEKQAREIGASRKKLNSRFMTLHRPSTLSSICQEAGISVPTYHVWRMCGLVPGWLFSKSMGRGGGRVFLYDEQEAMRCISRIKAEKAKGWSIRSQAERMTR